MRRLAWLPGMLLFAALLAAGCAGAPALDTGPLGNGGIHALQCTPGRSGKPLTLGLFAFHNSGSSAAVITRVDLADPHGLRMITPVIVPITTTTEIGNWASFPPRLTPDLKGPWAHRQRAVDAHLAPGGTHWNLVFGLQPTTRPYGRSDGVGV